MKNPVLAVVTTLLVLSNNSFASIHKEVDSIKGNTQITRDRVSRFSRYDKCVVGDAEKASFAEVIDDAIEYNFVSKKVSNQYYGNSGSYNPYSLYEKEDQHPVGLMSHRFCELTKEETKHLIGNEKWYPKETTYLKAKSMVDFYNKRFDKIENAKSEIKKLENQIEINLAHAKNQKRKLEIVQFKIKEMDVIDIEVLEKLENEALELKASLERVKVANNKYEEKIEDLKKIRKKSKGDIKEFYQGFFSCMAYTESLGDPDVPKSKEIYQEQLVERFGTNPEKAKGVKYYYDRPPAFLEAFYKKKKEYIEERVAKLKKKGKSEEEAMKIAKSEAGKIAVKYAKESVPKSWLSIGLFQFSSKPGSSILPCVNQWNKRFQDEPSCHIEPKKEVDYLAALGGPLQAFNAFCGVQRISTQFDSMVNTSSYKKAALGNRLEDGQIKDGKNRCVSLFSRNGKSAFVHYSALANSLPGVAGVGNMEIFLRCTTKAISKID